MLMIVDLRLVPKCKLQVGLSSLIQQEANNHIRTSNWRSGTQPQENSCVPH